MARTHVIPSSAHADIYALWKSGKTYTAIAAMYGVAIPTVWRIVQRVSLEAGEKTGARKCRVKPRSVVVYHPEAPEGSAYIQARGGEMITVDLDMVPELSKYSWCLSTGYAFTQLPSGKHALMHRMVLGLTGRSPQVDHINRCRTDNRRANLRIATNAQNAANSGPRAGRTLKGVNRNRNGQRWIANIMVDGKSIHLGTFDTQEAAARAYNKAAKEAFGEFAWLNPV